MEAGQQLKIQFKGKTVVIEALGFTGTACDLAVSKIANALGTTVAKDLKPEYYQQDVTVEQQQTH